MQPSGSVAKWDGDRLTFWGMGQGIYPARANLANALGIDPSKIRFINKWNGSTFGAARLAAERFYPLIAHLAKVTGRPVKVMLPKDQELAQLVIKPETITKFKVGVKKDGRITAIHHEVYVSVGELEFGVHADGPGNAFNQLELYTSQVPHWRSLWCAYRTNAPRPGPRAATIQQETKWSWENMMDEMAEAAGHGPGRVPPDAHYPAHARRTRDIRTNRSPPWRFWKKAPRPSDGTREIRWRAARREDSSADSASACRSITAA